MHIKIEQQVFKICASEYKIYLIVIVGLGYIPILSFRISAYENFRSENEN